MTASSIAAQPPSQQQQQSAGASGPSTLASFITANSFDLHSSHLAATAASAAAGGLQLRGHGAPAGVHGHMHASQLLHAVDASQQQELLPGSMASSCVDSDDAGSVLDSSTSIGSSSLQPPSSVSMSHHSSPLSGAVVRRLSHMLAPVLSGVAAQLGCQGACAAAHDAGSGGDNGGASSSSPAAAAAAPMQQQEQQQQQTAALHDPVVADAAAAAGVSSSLQSNSRSVSDGLYNSACSNALAAGDAAAGAAELLLHSLSSPLGAQAAAAAAADSSGGSARADAASHHSSCGGDGAAGAVQRRVSFALHPSVLD